MIFPVSVYKTLVLHEDFETFSLLRATEKKLSKQWVAELCKYSISCSSPMFTLYFSKDVKVGKSKFINEIINEILASFDSAKHLFLYYEEKLYFVEYLLNYFTIEEAKAFKDVVNKLLDGSKLKGNFTDGELKWGVYRTQNSALLFQPNPVKICVLIANILIRLDKVYPNLLLSETYSKVCKLWNIIINHTNNLEEIDVMLNDRCYSGMQVIDIIGYNRIDDLLENKKICNFIENIWFGPYERESVTSLSTTHQILFSANNHDNLDIFVKTDRRSSVLKWIKNPKKRCWKILTDKEK